MWNAREILFILQRPADCRKQVDLRAGLAETETDAFLPLSPMSDRDVLRENHSMSYRVG